MEFEDEGLQGLKPNGLGFLVWGRGLGFRVFGLGFRVQGVQ